MRNAKEEFKQNFELSEVKCATISMLDEDYEFQSFAILKIGYTSNDMDEFLNKLDYEYHSGYGTQQLDGIVWLTNNNWSTRGEYDGSEWWEHLQLPNIPDTLK